MAATTSEVGISPVLLQAITHLSSSSRVKQEDPIVKHNGENAHRVVIASAAEEPRPLIKMDNPGSILQGMNQPIASQHEDGETVVIMQASVDEVGEQVENVDPILENAKRQVVKNVANGQHGGEPEVSNPNGDVNMGSVLTAIASHLKSRSVNILRKQRVGPEDSVVEIQDAASGDPQTVYVTYASNVNVPSPSNDITVSAGDIENVVTETVVQTSPTDLSSQPVLKRYKIDIPSDAEGQTMIIVNPENLAVEGGSSTTTTDVTGTTYQLSGAPFTWKAGTGPGSLVLTSPSGKQQQVSAKMPFQPCPICGDRISGYHYGIYSCESCKGFFKRTVQNKKAFICHRKGECAITIGNRKKCPACRFKRCLVTGMKLEAIREDRTRGGRSSYDGCSPHGRLAKPPSLKSPPAPRLVQVSNTSAKPAGAAAKSPVMLPVTTSTPGGTQVITMVRTDGVEEQLVEGGEEYIVQVQPTVPQVLEDLMAVESLMSEEDGELACCKEHLQEGDANYFGSILHFADHCLYKIVRWARNLPDFAKICTDDQILLLQNCWAELLCLSCSYHSRFYQQEERLRLAYGRLLDLDTARAIGMGEVAERLLAYAEHMRRLEVDTHEFVALKVLMLLTPDVRNLKDEDVVRSYQDQLCEALMVYTSSHYQHRPEKVCQMLATLPEISRTCLIGKDLLMQRQNAGDIPQYSLLSELLKGDIAVQ